MKLTSISKDGRWLKPVYRLSGYVCALLAVAASTIVGVLIAQHWGNDPVVLLYIPPVLATAAYRGLRPALAAAVASTLAYNYYFVAPYRTFVISSPADVVTVVILFLVAAVTSQLAGSLRRQAELAAAYAARNATIAGFARRLLSCTDEQTIATTAVRDLSQLFHCHAVLIAGAEDPQLLASAPGNAQLAPSDFAAAAATLNSGEATGRGVRRLDLADWQFRPVTSDQTIMAAVGMARDDGTPPIARDDLPLLGNLLDQVALALERARLECEAREIATLRERDKLRSALLSSIGEDVKPRLNTIAAAARALKRSGTSDKGLITSVATEVTRLDRYIDNLVDISPGSDPEPFDVGSLTIDLHRRAVSREGVEIHLTPKEYSVFVELAKHAGRVLTHGHLLRAVWGPAQAEQIEYLRVAIRSLRQKLESDPARPKLIVNEPAVGYRLVFNPAQIRSPAPHTKGPGFPEPFV
jgi:two-component system, OmpR family, sensor histidine kinase KdpD